MTLKDLKAIEFSGGLNSVIFGKDGHNDFIVGTCWP